MLLSIAFWLRVLGELHFGAMPEAVRKGLILGSLLVLFTEPPGLALWESAIPALPWGRWPLTVRSAAWGLVVKLAAGRWRRSASRWSATSWRGASGRRGWPGGSAYGGGTGGLLDGAVAGP